MWAAVVVNGITALYCFLSAYDQWRRGYNPAVSVVMGVVCIGLGIGSFWIW